MRLPNFNPVLTLVLMGCLFAMANMWLTAGRSTVPYAIDGTVTAMDRRLEKHPGLDDVYLISIDSGRWMQIDKLLFDLLHNGSQLTKQRWSKQIEVDGQSTHLEFSRDFVGMVRAFPLICSILVGFGLFVVKQRPRPL